MPKNLENKIRVILEDCENLEKRHTVERIKTLILSEISFLEAKHTVDGTDLSRINGFAIEAMNNMMPDPHSRMSKSPDSQKSLAFLKAVVTFLRSKQLISFTLEYKDKYSKM